MINIIFTE